MLAAVTYTYQGQHYEVHFRHVHALLPVKLRRGGVALLPWGRRKTQPGKLPYGGCIHLNAIYAGLWQPYHPRPVRLDLESFMILDYENHPRWYDQKNSLADIQGLVARLGSEQRVYVVVIDPRIEFDYHAVWPRCVFA